MATPILALALAMFLQAPGQPPWQTVSSQDGQFTIDMPTQPNFSASRTQTGPGGRVKVSISGCKTASGVYLVYVIESPTRIARGAEQTFLSIERDDLAKEYHGKVVSEKQVRLDASLGRDFTIQGNEPGVGVVNIRVREYLMGKAIYALLVSSLANRELPEDASRFFGSFAFGASKDGKSRASDTRSQLAGKPVEGWGVAFDPYDDSQFRPEGRTLSVVFPGTHREMGAHGEALRSPRVLRDAEGDVTVQVKVVGDFKPEGKSTDPKYVPYNGAGLLLWSDAGNYLRLERAAILRRGKMSTYANVEEYEGGGHGASFGGPLAPGTAYLRLERRGGRVTPSVSGDGAHWTPLRPVDISWPAKIKVGVLVSNSNTEPLSVTFEDFTVNGSK